MLAELRRLCSRAGHPTLELRVGGAGILDERGPIGRGSGAPDGVAEEIVSRLGEGSWLVTIDDVHLVDPEMLEVITSLAALAPGRSGALALARRPWPRQPVVVEIERVLDAVPIRTGATTPSTLVRLPGVDGDEGRASTLLTVSGGNLGLALAVLADGGSLSGDGRAGPGRQLLAIVGRELELLGPSQRRALVAAWIGADLARAGTLRAVDGEESTLTELTATGLVAADGTMPAAVRAALHALVDLGERAAIADRLADALRGTGAAPQLVAPYLAASATISAEDASLLLEAARDVQVAPGVAQQWVEAARRAGADGPEVDATMAELAWRSGRRREAVQHIGSALGGEHDARLDALAGAVFASAGKLIEAMQRFRSVAEDDPSGVHQARADLCAALAGVSPEGASDAGASRSPLAAALSDTAASVAEALSCTDPAEVRALAWQVAGWGGVDDPFAPDDPRTVAGAMLASAGALEEAARLLESEMGPARARALGALYEIQSGDLANGREILEALEGESGDRFTAREALVTTAAATAIARRGSDHAGLRDTWEKAAPWAMSCEVEPLLLGLWGELVVAAARASSPDVDALARRVDSAMEGRAGMWAAEQAWWQLQQAVAADDAASAARAAERLGEIADDATSERTTALAHAARTWAALLADEPPSAESVAEAAAGLADHGLSWEGSALAGGAALRASESGDTKQLLAVGRKLRSHVSDEEEGGALGALSEREREVAELVVTGLTHKEVGARLYISAKTVEHHVARIRQKLGASTRAEMLSGLKELLPSSSDE